MAEGTFHKIFSDVSMDGSTFPRAEELSINNLPATEGPTDPTGCAQPPVPPVGNYSFSAVAQAPGAASSLTPVSQDSQVMNDQWAHGSQVKGWKRRARMGGKGLTQTVMPNILPRKRQSHPRIIEATEVGREKKGKCKNLPL